MAAFPPKVTSVIWGISLNDDWTPAGNWPAPTVAPKAYPVTSHSISTPPWVLDIVSVLQTVRLLLPLVNAIADSIAIVIDPVADTWAAGSLHPKTLLTVEIVKLYVVSTARPGIAGSPNIETVFVAVCVVFDAPNCNGAIPPPAESVNSAPFIEVILNELPITTALTGRLAVIICVLNPFSMSTTWLSFCGAAVLTVYVTVVELIVIVKSWPLLAATFPSAPPRFIVEIWFLNTCVWLIPFGLPGVQLTFTVDAFNIS